MKKINEIRDWLLDNAVDEKGNLVLVGLDFSNFNGNIDLRAIKAKGDVDVSYMDVGGNLAAEGKIVGGNLDQGYNVVSGYINQPYSGAGGDINQPGNISRGKIYQHSQTCLELQQWGSKADDGVNQTGHTTKSVVSDGDHKVIRNKKSGLIKATH